MSIGTYTLIKNEITWIGPHLMSWLPIVDEMVFFDGNSKDGTLDVLLEFVRRHPLGRKVKVFANKDPKNLQDDYVLLFNEAISQIKSDYCIFLHPDMFRVSGDFKKLGDALAYTTTKISYGAERIDDQIYEISEGRADKWKDVMRRRNPDLGLHYFGHYGANNEDTYFREITGDNHEFHGKSFDKYPYEVMDSGVVMAHFSDIRPYGRRLSRMISCLQNQGHSKIDAETIAPTHPRVTLKSGNGFSFVPVKMPDCYKDSFKDYKHFMEASAVTV